MDNNTTIKKSSTTTQQQLHSRTSALGNVFGLLLATIALLVMSLILLITGEHRSPTDHITKPTTATANVAYCTNQANATWDANIHNNNRTAIADTGASQHYLHGNAPISNFNINGTPTLVNTANGQSIQSTGQAKLLLPNLPPGSKDCHIMPSFTNNLLSMGKFCDAGCTVIFTDTEVKVIKKTGAIILQGHWEQAGAKMWQFNIHPDHPPAEVHTATTTTHNPQNTNPHIIPPDIKPQSQQPPMSAAPHTIQQPATRSPPHQST